MNCEKKHNSNLNASTLALSEALFACRRILFLLTGTCRFFCGLFCFLVRLFVIVVLQLFAFFSACLRDCLLCCCLLVCCFADSCLVQARLHFNLPAGFLLPLFCLLCLFAFLLLFCRILFAAVRLHGAGIFFALFVLLACFKQKLCGTASVRSKASKSDMFAGSFGFKVGCFRCVQLLPPCHTGSVQQRPLQVTTTPIPLPPRQCHYHHANATTTTPLPLPPRRYEPIPHRYHCHHHHYHHHADNYYRYVSSVTDMHGMFSGMHV